MPKNEVGPLPIIYKSQLKMDLRLKVLEDNTSQNVHNIGFGNNFLAMTQKS